MKCPDCKKDVKFNREYCPHCSGELSKNHHKTLAKPFAMVSFPGVVVR